VGPPRTVARHDHGLSTEIGRWRDGNGNQLAGSKRSRLSRMRREHSRGRFGSKAEQNLAYGLGEVRRITSALGLSESIRNQACQLFRSAQNEDLLRGRSIEAIAAGCVYATCRCNGLGRTIDEIVALARVNQQRVMNAYTVLNQELGLPTQPIRPSRFVLRLASELGVSDKLHIEPSGWPYTRRQSTRLSVSVPLGSQQRVSTGLVRNTASRSHNGQPPMLQM